MALTSSRRGRIRHPHPHTDNHNNKNDMYAKRQTGEKGVVATARGDFDKYGTNDAPDSFDGPCYTGQFATSEYEGRLFDTSIGTCPDQPKVAVYRFMSMVMAHELGRCLRFSSEGGRFGRATVTNFALSQPLDIFQDRVVQLLRTSQSDLVPAFEAFMRGNKFRAALSFLDTAESLIEKTLAPYFRTSGGTTLAIEQFMRQLRLPGMDKAFKVLADLVSPFKDNKYISELLKLIRAKNADSANKMQIINSILMNEDILMQALLSTDPTPLLERATKACGGKNRRKDRRRITALEWTKRNFDALNTGDTATYSAFLQSLINEINCCRDKRLKDFLIALVVWDKANHKIEFPPAMAATTTPHGGCCAAVEYFKLQSQLVRIIGAMPGSSGDDLQRLQTEVINTIGNHLAPTVKSKHINTFLQVLMEFFRLHPTKNPFGIAGQLVEFGETTEIERIIDEYKQNKQCMGIVIDIIKDLLLQLPINTNPRTSLLQFIFKDGLYEDERRQVQDASEWMKIIYRGQRKTGLPRRLNDRLNDPERVVPAEGRAILRSRRKNRR